MTESLGLKEGGKKSIIENTETIIAYVMEKT